MTTGVVAAIALFLANQAQPSHMNVQQSGLYCTAINWGKNKT
jgi:hypothetical protein